MFKIKDIILAVFLTFIVPAAGIYYGKKNNQPQDIDYSATLFVLGIWYLILRGIGTFVEYNYLYFAFATFAYFTLVFLVYKITGINLDVYQKNHTDYLPK